MRLLMISDLDADIEALRALDERYDHVICPGDLVDYGASPRGATVAAAACFHHETIATMDRSPLAPEMTEKLRRVLQRGVPA